MAPSHGSRARASGSRGGASAQDDDDVLRRVASGVQSSTMDESAVEVVLETAPGPAPPLPRQLLQTSRARSTTTASPEGDMMGGPSPLARARSTPHPASSSPGGGRRRLGYALRKVFSKEEEADWHYREAEGLMKASSASEAAQRHSRPSPDRAMSRVTSHVANMTGGWHSGDDEGAELVLDDADLYDDDDVMDQSASLTDSDRDSGFDNDSSLFREEAEVPGKFDKRKRYSLRRFLSAPGKKQSQLKETYSIRKTPSYKPEGYETELSRPVGLTRTLSSRLKGKNGRSGLSRGGNGRDDDLSTVAESVDSSQDSASGGKRRGRTTSRKRLGLALVFFAFGCAGVAAYIIIGDPFSKGADDTSSASVYVGVSADEGSEDDQLSSVDADAPADVYKAGEMMAAEEEEASRASEDQSEENETATFSDDDEVVKEWNGSGSEQESTPDEAGNVEETNPFESKPPPTGEPDGTPEPPKGTEEVDVPNWNFVATTSSPVARPTNPPMVEEIDRPTDAPTPGPTGRPTKQPTPDPTYSPTADTYTKFYLMADCPYDDHERQELMPGYIEDLSSDAEFLVHLGDLQYAKADYCREYAYKEARDILIESPVPTFVLPGDNDINDCDDHEHGEEMWMEYFHKIDERWDHSFDVTRWGDLEESFSFLHKRVLYFGVNIVGGSPYSRSEKSRRHKEHLKRIRGILDDLNEDDFDVLILLGHADPSEYHEDFFEGSNGFAAIAEELEKPTVHFHGDYHEYYEVEGGGYDLDNYVKISLDGESIAPPIKVEIDTSRSNPVRISRRRSDLDVDCCKYGWPRRDEL